jgi:ADP-sugar diphosphatase
MGERQKMEWTAKARVAAFLLYHLKTSPVAFIVRYIDKQFLTTYLHLRGWWLMPKLALYFLVILCVAPWCYFQALPHHCTQEDLVRREECDAEDFLRSVWSLGFGPLCLIPCLLACYRNLRCNSHPLTDRFLLMAQKYLPMVTFSGLGPWYRAGTGGLAAQVLVQKVGEEMQEEFGQDMLHRLHEEGGYGYRWIHDGLGAVDVIMVIAVVNISFGILIVVCPCLRAVYLEWDSSIPHPYLNAFQVASTSVGIGFAAAILIVRTLFLVANVVFGAPARLAKAVAGVLVAAKIRGRTWQAFDEERRMDTALDDKTVTFAQMAEAHQDMSEVELRGHWDSLQIVASRVHDRAKSIAKRAGQELTKKVLQVPAMERDEDESTAAGLLWSLYRDAGEALSMPFEQFELFASLAPEGYVMACADPEYETLENLGFQLQFLTDTIYVHGHVLMMEERGSWRVKHTDEYVQELPIADFQFQEQAQGAISIEEPQPQQPSQPLQIQIGTAEVSVTAEQETIDLVESVNAAPFKEWVRTVEKNPRMLVEKITIQSVDMFGPRFGFIKFKADVKVDGKAPPGIVFMRGGAVAVLVVLKHGTSNYTVMVRQPRVAVGNPNMPEIPAGMLDGEGRFSGVAAKEMQEETGISIAETELIDMTQLVYGDEYPGMYPSCGASDEFNRLFLYRREVSAEELADMQGRLHGVVSEGEIIKLEILPLTELWKKSPDAKALGALCLHDKLIAEGKIPPF